MEHESTGQILKGTQVLQHSALRQVGPGEGFRVSTGYLSGSCPLKLHGDSKAWVFSKKREVVRRQVFLCLVSGDLCLGMSERARLLYELAREPAPTIQHGTRGCAAGLPTELLLPVILPVSSHLAGFPDERQVLFQGMRRLQVL